MFNKKQVIFHPGNCLNTKKPYPKQCRLCFQYCPHEAISEEMEIQVNRCTECGVCMAVCPSDGFVDRDIDNLKEYLFENETIILNCPAAKPLGYEIGCLGMLDRDAWLSLMIMAESKAVRVVTGDCGQCDDKQACSISVAFFKEIYNNWQDDLGLKIEIIPDQSNNTREVEENKANLETKETAKRSKGIRQLGKDKVKNFLPSIIAEETYPIPRTRQWLLELLKESPTKKVPSKALKIDEKCTNCGVCAKICPQEALQLVQKEGKIRLIYEAAKCVHCNRCVEICGPQAMRFEEKNMSYKLLTGKILIRESEPRYCDKCGKQIFHNIEPGLCMSCAAKDPDLKGILY